MNKINIDITILGDYSNLEGLESEAEKLPKTSREQFKKVLNLLKKEKESKNEKFYYLSTGAFKFTTFGYLFFAESKIYLIEVKPPFGKLKLHKYEYKNYDQVDYDVIKAFGITSNVIHLNKSGIFGKKKDQVTHISSPDFLDIYKFVKLQTEQQ